MGLLHFHKNPREHYDLVSSFLTKAEGLQRILEKETQYFRSMKIKQAEMLLEAKMKLINELEEIRNTMTADPSLLANMPTFDKNRVRQANDDLLKAVVDNFNETKRAKEVNKIILEAIADAVNQNQGIEGAYGGTGVAYRSEISKPVAVVHNA